MAAADCSSRRRFAVACSVLSRRVKAEAAEKIAAAHPAPAPAPVPSTMLLMPGAHVQEEPETTPESGAAQLTIMYAGRVLVFDDFPVDKAAELVRVAAGQDVPGGGLADMPMARKASLQRFMEKRRDRISALAPYAGRPSAAASKKGKENEGAGCLLRLAGGSAAR